MLRLMLLLCLLAPEAFAAPACLQHFAARRPPALLNPRLAQGTTALCFEAFAVLHSGATRTPLFSAEHLTPDSVAAARGVPRQGMFHAEPELETGSRAELSDYARSGYDRGHMSPSGDMPTDSAQAQSFTLANMVPQAPKLNRGLWEGVESAIRTRTELGGELYVVTGPAFRGTDLATTGNVLVPTHVWKAIYDPVRQEAGAYVVENLDSGRVRTMSMARLADFTGVEVFPGLPFLVRQRLMRLPRPTPHYGHSRGARD